MQWSDDAILLSVSKYGERGGVVGILCREQGIYRSISKNAYTKSQRGLFQPGNLVNIEWKARLSEHMGSITTELLQPIAPLLLDDPVALNALNSLCGLLLKTIHEREPHPALYDKSEALLQHMAAGNIWLPYYVKWEISLLRELGFGLDLSQCASTGEKTNLHYVSPKSGRAVCAHAAEPYKDRLLRLPAFLISDVAAEAISDADLRDGLKLTGYFLRNWIADPHRLAFPQAREQLFDRLEKRAQEPLSEGA